MTTSLANAFPRKHFFLEMFTRDISLEDCILDLIDNSIDGLVKTRNIDISTELLRNGANSPPKRGSLAKIEVRYSPQEFEITDFCGGIDRAHALNEVFNFGHGPGEVGGALGVYGIGLKRAIFKIGDFFQMESRTDKEGFSVELNVTEWSAKDQDIEDWKIPLKMVPGATAGKEAGTKIRITRLRSEVVMRLKDGVFETRLRSLISQTYGLFLQKYVEIALNGVPIEPFSIPIGTSKEVQPAHDEYKDGQNGEVLVRLFASLAARGPDREWRGETAGWYALCNGRIVVAADKTELTGWGSGALPQFHSSKFRGFLGVAFFQSSNPLALPWTTTKRGLNRESPVYQNARNRMRGVARPIITFLDGMYKPEAPEQQFGKEIADQVKATTLAAMASKPVSTFVVTMPARQPPSTTTSIQYEAERSDVERVRKHLKKPSLAAWRVGKHTFEHYLKTECPQ